MSWLGFALLLSSLWLMARRVHPVHLGAAWMLIALLPFLPATLANTGSRYLYLASAGSSLMLAGAIYTVCRLCGPAKHYLYIALLMALTYSSYLGLRSTEAISLYDSARNAIYRHQLEDGALFVPPSDRSAKRSDSPRPSLFQVGKNPDSRLAKPSHGSRGRFGTRTRRSAITRFEKRYGLSGDR